MSTESELITRLSLRMQKPQRHRLLQGFPAVPAMVPATSTDAPPSPGQSAAPAKPNDEEDDDEDAPPSRRFRAFDFRRTCDGSLIDLAFAQARESLSSVQPPPPVNPTDPPDLRAQNELRQERHRKAVAHWQAVVARGDHSQPPLFSVDTTRDLIVGVIPHTQCVPRTEACGFCTFPHDVANARSRRSMQDAVIVEIHRHAQSEALAGRRLHAIYLGGGTANLCEPEEIAQIVQALARGFVIDEAELSLEGTPHLFERLLSSHLRNLAKQPTASKRISIGVQTFDPDFLRLMGRQKFGGASTVRRVTKKAHSLGIATSADLLFNLPGQTPEQMDRDLDIALSCGLHQICLYNLVLYAGLGTPWSKDAALVRAMPNNATACENWLRLRQRLLSEGYVQTTLTNFERADIAAGPAHFRYETASFSMERTDGLGIGPLGLSTFVNLGQHRGIKLLRRKNIAGQPWSRSDLMFCYDEQTLPLLFLTRSLAKTRVSGPVYRSLFGTALAEAFAAPLAACQAAGLVRQEGEDLCLTPIGMFYADAVVATFADGVRRPGAGLHTADLLRERPQAEDYIGMG